MAFFRDLWTVHCIYAASMIGGYSLLYFLNGANLTWCVISATAVFVIMELVLFYGSSGNLMGDSVGHQF